MEIQLDAIRRDGAGKRVDPPSTRCNDAGRETRKRVVNGMHLNRVERRGLGHDGGDRGIRSSEQLPADPRRHETVGPVEVVAGSYDHASFGHSIRKADAAGHTECASDHIALEVQADLAVRCEVNCEDSVCPTWRTDNGS